jgi:hypothetical protein
MNIVEVENYKDMEVMLMAKTFEWKQADGRYSTENRRDHEKTKIEQHKPSGNKSSGGEGRISKK